jgi:hypothetical protein
MQPLELFRFFRRPILIALSIVLVEKLASSAMSSTR